MEAKRKRTKNIIIAAVLVVVAILMAALPAMLSSGQKEENTGTAKSVAVQRGNIDSTVAGAGTLSGGDGVKITVPHGVEITEYLVANGDVVAEGQALAAVDKTSVMNTIATVQNNLEYLAGQVRTAASGATNAYLAAPPRAASRRSTPMPATTCSPSSASTALLWSSRSTAHGRGRGNGVRRRDARQERHRPLRGRHGICGPHRDPPRQYPHRNAHG